MEIALESIAVKSNPRTDFGQIDEMAASIREKGTIEPLVVKKLYVEGNYNDTKDVISLLELKNVENFS